MSYTKRVLQGITVVFLANILTNLFGYLLRLYLGRTLSTAEFGLVYGIFSLFGVVALFIYLGLIESVVKFLSDFRAKGSKQGVFKTASSIIFFELLLSVIVCGTFFFLADWIAAVYFKTPGAAPLIRLFAVAIGISPFSVLCTAIFQAYQRPLYYSGLALTQSLLLMLGTIGLFVFFPALGLSSAFIPYIVFYALCALFCIPLSRKLIPKFSLSTKYVNFTLFKQIFLYSIPITLTTLSYAILVHTDTLMITYFRSLEDVGLYNAALPTANILLFFASSITAVFFPIVAELWTKKKRALLAGAMRQAYILIGATIVPAVALFVAFPDIIINILFGAKFLPASPSLQVLALASIFTTLSMFNGSILAGIGKPKLMSLAVLVGALANIIGNAILIPRIGIVGAAIATLCSSFFIFFVNTRAVHRSINFSFPMREWVLTVVAGGVLLSIVSLLREIVTLPLWWKLAIVLPAGGIVYVVCLWAFRVITIDEIKTLLRTLR